MRTLFLIILLGALFIFSFSASAQTDITLSNVTVQLWPEYDQPSMLVIVDFKVAPMTSLPVDLTFNIPADSNLIAVAFQAEDGSLINANFTQPQASSDQQTFTVTIQQNVGYRFEYYQPLQFKANDRNFLYVWNQSYAVKNFSVSVLEPIDVTSFSMQPKYVSTQELNGLNFYEGEVLKLPANQEYTLDVQYKKTSLTLVTQPQQVQPADPLNEDTPGRASLNNFLPYLIGGFAILFISVGVVYYWRFGRTSNKRARRRRIVTIEDDDPKTGMYCSQCGTRAMPTDKFCRTCGSKLKKSVE